MILDVASIRPCATLMLKSNIHDKYTCVYTAKNQQHMSPVLMHKYGAGTECSISCKSCCFDIGLCRPYKALQASYEQSGARTTENFIGNHPQGPHICSRGGKGGLLA